MNYEYKTVPAPMILNIKTQKEAEQAIASFGERINFEAVDGWEFHSMESITTAEAPGCFSGGKQKMTTYNMLVFKREIAGNVSIK
jgi:hypothetical protein